MWLRPVNQPSLDRHGGSIIQAIGLKLVKNRSEGDIVQVSNPARARNNTFEEQVENPSIKLKIRVER